MTSPRGAAANQRNAAESTGPRTAAGKRRSSQNARRHGLATSIAAHEFASQSIKALAKLIVGDRDMDPVMAALALQVAEAQLDLNRARIARTECLGKWLESSRAFRSTYPGSFVPAHDDGMKAAIASFQEIARSLGERTSSHIADMVAFAFGPLTLAVDGVTLRDRKAAEAPVLLAEKDIMRIDRYERRALSRRKKALRAFVTGSRSGATDS